MAGAVPGALRRVPADDAPHVRAGRGQACDFSGWTAVRGDLRSVTIDDATLAALERAQRSGVAGREAIANQVVRIVGILLEIVPAAQTDRGARRIEQLRPRILAAQDGVADHDRRQRAERDAVAGVT